MPGTGLVLNGNNWAQTPDHSSFDLFGNVDVRGAMALADWTPTQLKTVLIKWAEPSQRSFHFSTFNDGSGKLYLAWSSSGSNGLSAASTAGVGVADGTTLAVRATLTVNNGSGQYEVRFYTKATTGADASTDCADDAGWTQLGSTVTAGITTGVFPSTSAVKAGLDDAGGNVQTLYACVLKNGINGTTVTDPDFYANDLPFTDPAGRPWFLAGGTTVALAEETDEALVLSSISGGGSDTATVGLATETDRALALVRSYVGPIIRNYPRTGILGCGTWIVQVSRRGGAPVDVEVPVSTVQCNRIEDEISSATVRFANSDVPDWCIGALDDLQPWVHEISLLRDGVQVWVGPISSAITFTPSATTIQARDLFSWMERRVLPFDRIFTRDDLSIIFEQYVDDALVRDPSPNIALDIDLSGVIQSRTIARNTYTRAADALRELAALGLDFTMLGRTMRVRGRGAGDLLPNPLLDAHVLQEPSAMLDGIEAASEWIVTGSTPSVARRAGGVGLQTGLVTQVYADSEITDPQDAAVAAAELLAASGAQPLQVSCALDPDAPFAFNDLVPGNFIDTRLSFGHYDVAEVMMLTGVDVSVGAGTEQVRLSLLRPSSDPLGPG